MALVTYFDPQPRELPARMPSPFAPDVHPLARRAADDLRCRVDALALALDAPGAGKMFGVLVVRGRDGRAGYLAACSGMLGGSWRIKGFVGPAFDEAARAAWWPAGEAELAARAARIAGLEAALAPLRAELAELRARQAGEATALRARHDRRRRDRRAARRALAPAAGAALDEQSRADGRERRAIRARHAAEHEAIAARLHPAEAELAAAVAQRAARSRELTRALHATYVLANARGDRRSLAELFAPAVPPTGAGDCAAIKLLAHAYREGLAPVALAELWLGAPPATGGRIAGRFYPPCRGKCGPILAHVLGGLAVEPPPMFGAAAEARVVFEDRWLIVVDKPAGVLSVPGRERDHSLQSALRARHPEAPALRLAHRLDLDTSGLVLAAKDAATYKALQAAFARRAIDKRYVAVLDGTPAADAGTIDLPLRVDLDDRPRQLVDPVHGKPAVTEWRVLVRAGAQTRAALWPRTGRTHQLRVHTAVGLGAPIAGDRLYGRGGERLLLHAEALAFEHPRTGRRIELLAPASF